MQVLFCHFRPDPECHPLVAVVTVQVLRVIFSLRLCASARHKIKLSQRRRDAKVDGLNGFYCFVDINLRRQIATCPYVKCLTSHISFLQSQYSLLNTIFPIFIPNPNSHEKITHTLSLHPTNCHCAK